MRSLVRGLVLVVALTASTGAQESPRPLPQVVVNASEEVDVTPDRAHVTVMVETRGRTSQMASQENARTASAAIQAITRAGIAAAQLRTVGLSVNPEYRYPEGGGRPTVVGYVAVNAVQVEIRDVSKIGGVIDAAIAQGATNVSGPVFSLANPDSARREALAVAVQRARADAEVMARAAGMRGGVVLEMLSSDTMERPMFDRPVMAMSRSPEVAVETPVAVGQIKVRASVTMRVQLVSTP